MLPIESNTSANIKNINALWLSPDEWLIYGKDIDKNLEINDLLIFIHQNHLKQYFQALHLNQEAYQ